MRVHERSGTTAALALCNQHLTARRHTDMDTTVTRPLSC
jgi:hypothetical protein